MTKNYYGTENYKVDHSTFGGIIYKGDFDAHHSMSDVTSRILSDWAFEKRCRFYAENRNNRYKNNKLEKRE